VQVERDALRASRWDASPDGSALCEVPFENAQQLRGVHSLFTGACAVRSANLLKPLPAAGVQVAVLERNATGIYA
jgi:hypothetical protein